jgi:hypothetical protein
VAWLSTTPGITAAPPQSTRLSAAGDVVVVADPHDPLTVDDDGSVGENCKELIDRLPAWLNSEMAEGVLDALEAQVISGSGAERT